MVKPKITYNEESETYKIEVGTLKIYLEYGADKEFNWTDTSESGIHVEQIQIVED